MSGPAMLSALVARLRAVLTSRHLDDELDEELAAHLAMATDDYMKKGMSPEDARRAAVLRLGGPTALRERHREVRGIPMLDNLVRDVRLACRTLCRDATLSTFVLLIIGLGVAATTTIFSLVNAVLLRPLPFEDPDRLVWISNGTSGNLSSRTVQVAHLVALKDQSQSLSGVAGFSPFYGAGDIHLTGAGDAERITGVPVTEDFFSVLGLRPHRGRFFTAEEARANAPKTVVLSHTFWQRRFAADPALIGQAIILDGTPATVLGVLPPSFDFAATFTPGGRADLFSPFPLDPDTNRQGNMLALIGRLRPGVSVTTTQAEAALIEARLEGTLPAAFTDAPRQAFRPHVTSLRDRVSGGVRQMLLVLTAAVGFLMLVMCANLSNLLIARASARRRDMAVRLALGAPRRRLMQQLLVESTMLSCAGAALGVALAWGGITLVARLEGTTIPLLHEVRLDLVALGFAAAVGVLTGIGLGVLPAMQVSAFAASRVLRETSRGSIGGRTDWLRRSLVVAEIALVCVMSSGAGLLVHSLMRVLDVDVGFSADEVIAVRADPGSRYATADQKSAYFTEVRRRVRAVSGVEALGFTDALPFGDNYGWRIAYAWAQEHAGDEGRKQTPLFRVIDEGYLEAMRIPLRAGRGFTSGDDVSNEPVVIINDTFARELWPDADPIGRIIVASQTERRVVGVVGDVRYFGMERPSGSEMYVPLAQTADYMVVDLVVRGAADPARLVPGIRAALAQVDGDVPTTEFRTMPQLMDRSVFGRRAVVVLLVGFAGFGLTLAALGIYAVVSHAVGQRRQEFGVRLALGASPGDLQRQVLRQTAGMALMGLAAGLPASWLTARAMQGLLYDVRFSDPATFGAVLALLAAVILLAGYLPARRAARTDPVTALRAD